MRCLANAPLLSLSWDAGQKLILSVKGEDGDSIQKVILTQGRIAWEGSLLPSGDGKMRSHSTCGYRESKHQLKRNSSVERKAYLITVIPTWFTVSGAFNSMG
jgi:hypothetical protein